MKIILIVAKTQKNVIGLNNQMPWKLNRDMQFFKETTTHHTILMGRKTFQSLGKPLKNRNNWVLSKEKNTINQENITLFSSVKDALETAENQGIKNLFVIGGSQIYTQTLPFADELLITHIKDNNTLEGDAFFPPFEENLYEKTLILSHSKDDKNDFDFEIIKYKKIK
jgi:dihydrofolate reductase